ncbi:nucleoside hydrolase [Bowmanella pacifica]|uniref:Nucleoside hydrolase n=1 Tax=Bowmanella pacifica TaxID=502051 RepID=A0A917Z138_9ALTE|nr:nucleoside hydrolase [Bowmanella pacifica]GGO71426.1 nucleoside hydrolase [Bowmanella pacifica]
MSRKIIIDTDPGVDDALAIIMAANSPELEVLGLTTVFGNVSVEQATTNALILSDFASYDIPVYKGEAVPMTRTPAPYADFVHGDDGFGNINWPVSNKQAQNQSAVDFIIEQVRKHPGEITLVPLGPLTNIARVLEKAPDIAGLVKEVVLMGGAARHCGNVSPVAEANIMGDPHAADKVFTADWPVVMIGLDVTSQVLLKQDDMQKIADKNPQQGEFLRQACDFYIDFYQQTLGIAGCMVHDPSTIAYLLDPTLFEIEEGRIRVVTEGLAVGQTTLAPGHRHFPYPGWENLPQQKVCMKVRSQALLDLVTSRLSA